MKRTHESIVSQKKLIAHNRDLKEMQAWTVEMEKTKGFRAMIKAEYKQNFTRILKEKLKRANRKQTPASDGN